MYATNGTPFREQLAAIRAGDETAFAELWRSVQPSLLRYLRVVAQQAADDLAADTWLEVVRAIDRFEGDERGFRAWVFTIARHRHLDWRRATARRPHQWYDPPELDTLVGGDDDPALAAETADATEAALRLIARLPATQAEVVTLRVVADLDVAQVARMLQKRPATVRVLSHRGLRRLASLLGAADDTPTRIGFSRDLF